MPALDPSSIQIKDYLHVKGVRLVEPGTPQWKIKPLQEKNLKLINEYLNKESQRLEEEQKWAAVPEWKKKLLIEKEKKAKELEEAQRLLEEAERKEKEKFESLPEWKRKLLIKKKSSSEMQMASDALSEASARSDSHCEESPQMNNVDCDASEVATGSESTPGVSSNGGGVESAVSTDSAPDVSSNEEGVENAAGTDSAPDVSSNEEGVKNAASTDSAPDVSSNEEGMESPTPSQDEVVKEPSPPPAPLEDGEVDVTVETAEES